MGRRAKNGQIEGQMSIFDFCLDASNYVVQSNEIISGKQSLSINAAKLLRSAIMQIKPDDEELKPYIVSIPNFAKLLNVSRQDIHKSIDQITDDIIQNPLLLKEEKNGKLKWVKIPWVSMCKYNSDEGIYIQLNEQLRPFLLKLQERYTQYTLDSILTMKSIYAIRIFELIQSKIMTKTLPREGKNVVLTVDEIRTSCDCIEKFERYSNFKAKVIETAIREINEKTMFNVGYLELKAGKSIQGIMFHINMKYH